MERKTPDKVNTRKFVFSSIYFIGSISMFNEQRKYHPIFFNKIISLLLKSLLYFKKNSILIIEVVTIFAESKQKSIYIYAKIILGKKMN